MRNSPLFIAIALSVSGLACAGSSAQTQTMRLSRVSAEQGLDPLWVGSQEVRSNEEVQLAYQSEEATSDLWMKRGPDSNTDNIPEKQTPRLDWVLNRITPDATSTFVEASHPSKGRPQASGSFRRLRAQAGAAAQPRRPRRTSHARR